MCARWSLAGRAAGVPSSASPLRFLTLLSFLLALIAAPAVLFADESNRRATSATRAPQPDWPKRIDPQSVPSAFIPVVDIPIEDVDAVEVAVPNPVFPVQIVWPTENNVHFYSALGGPAAPIVDIPTVSPGVTGCDFVANLAGTFGVYQTLGVFYMYDLTGVPPFLASSGFLPGPVPQRRDIDPLIFADPLSPSGQSAIFVTGTGLHCRTIPGGAVRWDLYLPSVMVEAVDPVMSPNGNLWAPCVTAIVKIDPIAGVVLSSLPNPTAPVREIDVRFSGAPLGPGPSAAWFPTHLVLSVYDDAPALPGFALAPAIPMPGAFIEGNDLEWNPALALGYLPTLPAMVQVDPVGLGIAAIWGLPGFAHQRNQDAVFTLAGAAVPKWVYAMQGAMVIGDDLFAAPPPAFLPSPGVTYDGVDPAFSDTPPFGEIVSIATSAATNVYHAPSVTFLASIPRTPGAGPLRTDVDHKPLPLGGNFFVQPAIGGLLSIGPFSPDAWVVTVANGIELIDLAALAVIKFMPYAGFGAPGAMTYRGGDGQPTFFSGPGEPAFSVDQPDQDFITKCWEYKYAMNRWPYWYSRTMPAFYPHHVPFGVFGPPALVGWDMLNHDKVVLLQSNEVQILNEHGSPIHQFPLPAPAIGGFVWDWDNKTCKIRTQAQLEVVINLTPLGYGAPPAVSFVPFGNYTRWYPIVDRMNGWEFAVLRGGRELWVFDHVGLAPVTVIPLPSRIIRRPVFDEQRKTLCMPLADRRVAFFDAHRFRVGLPPHQYLYYSPILAGHVVAAPVFDFYNHHTVLQLQGRRLAILNTSNANLIWAHGPLPYRSLSPIQIDCYNKIAKGFYRDAALNHYEMWLDLYPMVFGGVPNLQWISLGTQVPYGYPVFDSMDGWELCRLGTNTIQVRNLFNIAQVLNVNTPFPIMGNLFIDRVNKYAVCALRGPRVFVIDLFRYTNGDPTAAKMVTFPLPPAAQATDDIVFLTQLRKAVVHVDNGVQTELVALNLHSATATMYPSLSGLPPVLKQMYAHPFRGLINYPWWNLGAGGEVTIDMTPTTWNPPQQPHVNVVTLASPPLEAVDDLAPPVPPAPVPLPSQPGDAPGVVHFDVPGLEPGSMLYAYMPNSEEFEPTEGTVEADGACDDISVVASGTEEVCFLAFDASGNASPPTCVTVTPSVDAGDPAAPGRLSFRLARGNPVRGEAQFALSLPERARVRIDVHDVGGRRLATLADGELESGEHAFTWRAQAGVASGVYFARLQSPLGEATARVVVIE